MAKLTCFQPETVGSARGVLEDLRLVTNYQMDSENRLCLLLVGLTELRRRLAMAVHESLAQRIVVLHHLTHLIRAELPEHLAHGLRAVGCELSLFEPPAVEALFQATQGMPRRVNRLAHYALTPERVSLWLIALRSVRRGRGLAAICACRVCHRLAQLPRELC